MAPLQLLKRCAQAGATFSLDDARGVVYLGDELLEPDDVQEIFRQRDGIRSTLRSLRDARVSPVDRAIFEAVGIVRAFEAGL